MAEKKDHVIEQYRRLAASPNINAMSGRNSDTQATAFVADRIAELMTPRDGETLVDIGCGDGSALIRMAARQPRARYIGILPTQEEVERLIAHLNSASIEVVMGRAEDTRLPDKIADKIVCNSVLHIVPDVDAALTEIARIARSGAMIYMGEILWRVTVPLPSRALARLRHEGLAGIWRAVRRVIRRWYRQQLEQGDPRPRLITEGLNVAPSETFIAMAERHGMRPIWHRPHPELDENNNAIESATRKDYLMMRG
jgi:ubiquinone/menaquinone biosynthesis C-methylase UbiE